MKKCTASLLAFLLICAGCKQQVKSAAFDDERIARSWEEMVAIHDDVMPEMSDINRLKRQLRKDSTQLELIIKLTEAEDGMWRWMHELKPIEEVQLMSPPDALEYTKQEVVKIQAVSRLMKESIREAQAAISQKLIE